MSPFTNVIVHHPYVIILGFSLLSGILLTVPLLLRKLPDFSDPQLGFETRGTLLAKRLIAWDNLHEATKSSGQLAVDPKTILLPKIYKYPKSKRRKSKTRKNKTLSAGVEGILVTRPGNLTESDIRKINNWKSLKELERFDEVKEEEHDHRHVSHDGFFCGTPDHRYSRVVLSSDDQTNLFTPETLMDMCYIEHQLIESKKLHSNCETIRDGECCHAWSLPNYVALLHNRTSCLAITEEDVHNTLKTLQDCALYYHNQELTYDCDSNEYCLISGRCSAHNAVYNILNYLTDTEFLPSNNSSVGVGDLQQQEKHQQRNKETREQALVLKHTMIFLPLACSTKSMDYYRDIERKHLKRGQVQVVAMELGLKNTLFDKCLIEDAWLLVCGGVCVLVCMWVYTESLFLTFMTIIAIMLSLGIAYFTYTIVFNLEFFPFMNLMACVVAVGIGADDAFIFCKVWQSCKKDKNPSMGVASADADDADGEGGEGGERNAAGAVRGSVAQLLLTDTLRHAILSMLVTSLTTAAAFYASLVSSITAVCCFGAFAGTAVIVNFCLMVVWLPTCAVLSERLDKSARCSSLDRQRNRFMRWWTRGGRLVSLADRVRNNFDRWLPALVLRFRHLWVSILGVLAVVSMIVVLWYPGLRLPDSPHLQLFKSSHPFEQYDLVYRHKFWFERPQLLRKGHNNENHPLPLRFVWGVLPQDNGNRLDPQAKGTLVMDGSFDMAHPDSQQWLLNFCRELRGQPFYQFSLGPLLPNCFIESFLTWMQRRCADPVERINRSPCCEGERFPFKREVFDKCVVQAMSDLYETPAEYFLPGVAGPKFNRYEGETDENGTYSPTIGALVVEYDSNYTHTMSFAQMHAFYTQVEAWTKKQMQGAPVGMHNGWFISDLEFYDLQRALSEGTTLAIAASMLAAFLVLCSVTLNVLVSLYAVTTITATIFTTVAVLLAILDWRLNVLESVAVSTAVGLAVDFTLHYGVYYVLCGADKDRRAAAFASITSMSGPTAMAALTTAAAGAAMLPSAVLAYVQIGTFLVVVMVVSWLYATFLFGSLLAVAGPERGFGQFACPKMKRMLCPRRSHADHHDDTEVSEVVNNEHQQYPQRTNANNKNLIGTAQPSTRISSESHELDYLVPGTSTVYAISAAVDSDDEAETNISTLRPRLIRSDTVLQI